MDPTSQDAFERPTPSAPRPRASEPCAVSLQAWEDTDAGELVHGLLTLEPDASDPAFVYTGEDGVAIVVRRDAITEVTRVKAGPRFVVDVAHIDDTGTTRTVCFVGAVERLAPLFAAFGRPVVAPHAPRVRQPAGDSDRVAPRRPRSRTPAPYASWGRRVVAFMADTAIVMTLFVVAWACLLVGARGPSGPGAASMVDLLIGSAQPSAVGLTLYLLLTLGALVFWVWNTMVRQGRTGYTLGKQWNGIRLVRADTRDITGVTLAVARTVAHNLDSMPCYLGWLWPLWDPKRRTFADMIAGTVVVVQTRAAVKRDGA